MSNIKNWMKIINEGSDSFDSDHSAENLVNYYDDEDRSPEPGETMDFEFGDKLAIEGIIDSYNENECVINVDSQAMEMLEDLNVIDTTEGYEVLPKMDRDKYQERDGLEGPIMTRSGKVVYYDNDKGDYYDPDTDMYIDYDDFKALDRKAITAEGYAGGDYASQEEVDDIAGSIKNRFMNDQNAMLYIIRNSSIEKFLDAIQDVAEFNAPMEEIGSSDMSILMKDVLQNLGLDPKEVFARESVEEGKADPKIVAKFAGVSDSQRSYYVMKWAEENGIDTDKAMEMAGYEKGDYMGAGAYNWRYVGESVNEAEEHTYTVVHAKHGKEEIKASSSYGAAKKYAEMKKLKGTSGVDAHLHTNEGFEEDEVKAMFASYPEDAEKVKATGELDMDSQLYMDLFGYYQDEMPYGTQKARDGDPVEWLETRLDDLGMIDEGVLEAKYQGKTVKLNKPIRTGKDEPKKFKVYVKDGDKVKLVRFGHQGKGNEKTMKIKKSDPKRRKSFRARHNCSNPGPKTKARYWSCRAW